MADLEAQAQSDDYSHLRDVDQTHLAALSHTLSSRSADRADRDLSPDDFQLESVLRRRLHASAQSGILDRAVGVLFRDLSVRGIDMATTSLFTLGEILMTPFRIREKIAGVRNRQLRFLIQHTNGLVNKGEMLLVLGRPGAGCSTFLRTIAGEVESYVDVDGTLLYDGIDQQTMKARFRGDLLYSAETDEHFPTLNVDQTLSFAADIKAPQLRPGAVSRKQYVADVRDTLATVFGLTHTFHTPVGDDYVRGVSGGERKRVSLAEVLAGRAQLVCWDNSTRGLDASTALEYTHTIRTTTNLLKNTAIVAIYQAGENIYRLFDKVTVLYLGRQVYFGPVAEARAYFERMGYYCPPRQTTAEFLTAVTDPAGRFLRSDAPKDVPVTADQFEAYWHNSPEYQRVVAEVEQAISACNPDENLKLLNESASQERAGFAKRHDSPYVLSFAQQLRVLIRRGFERQKGDRAYMIANVFASIFQSLITGSLFYNIPHTYAGSFSRGGVLFFSVLFFTLNSLAEMAVLYPQRKIVDKQRRYAFYHPGAEALAYMITAMPVKMVSVTIFTLILYFMTNLNRTPGQFFFLYLIVNVTTFTMTAFFQMIASYTPSLEAANAVAGLFLMMVFIYAGYLIPRPFMKVWFGWLSRANPLAYAFESLMASEFHGSEYSCTEVLIPQGSAAYDAIPLANKVCAATGSRPGRDYILGDDYIGDAFEYKWSHAWRNFGLLIVFAIGFVVLYAIGCEIRKPSGTQGDVLIFKRGHVPEEEELKRRQQQGGNADLDGRAAAVVEVESESEKPGLSDSSDSGSKTAVALDEEAMLGKLPSRVNSTLQMNEIFSWQNVNYTVTLDDGEKRQLLCDVQGYTKPGTLTALMGESGAGKTTLLNTLAQRIDVGVISGGMLVDGKALNAGFKRRTGYVQQQDMHVAESTVRESLRFAALLRQPATVPIAEKYEYVETVIEMLGMEAYAEAIVGSPGSGLNVEQRKKLSIGVELASKPSLLLFLDEPTSGLDSQSAWAVVQLLRKLANAGQSILCTIHQPSATLFEQFDKLLLLKKGGQTVYFGEIGDNSRKVIEYFEGQGAPKCGSEENPAEYILNCIGAGATAVVDRNWYEVWQRSTNYEALTREIAELHAELSQLPAKEVGKEFTGKFAVPWTTQALAVVIRTYQTYWRSPSYLMAKLMLLITGGLFVGFSFWHNEFSVQGVQNLIFGVFLPIVLAAPLINQLQPRAIEIRELYDVREAASNTYHWSALQLSMLLVEIPYNILFTTVFYCCYYFPADYFREASRAGYFYFSYAILYTSFWTTFGLAITTFVPDAATANIATSVFFSMILSFAGFFQPPSMFPGFWVFMYRISPHTYFLQSLLGTVLHGGKITCKENEFNIFTPPGSMTCYEYAGEFTEQAGGYLNNPNATSNCEFCKWQVADQYLETVGVNYGQRWRNVGIEIGFVLFNVFFMFAGFYLFRVMKWRRPGFLRREKKEEEKKVEV
ncbi:ABC-2 type transporter-domain-containing protein [Myxozyma melibiosi]|uniref:ABC-2 type transporter-domain-containing protein n=1 Tax=Myxozyma melibiosi TaxID=54550 RepID=A0ABR1F3X2_9ASCO